MRVKTILISLILFSLGSGFLFSQSDWYLGRRPEPRMEPTTIENAEVTFYWSGEFDPIDNGGKEITLLGNIGGYDNFRLSTTEADALQMEGSGWVTLDDKRWTINLIEWSDDVEDCTFMLFETNVIKYGLDGYPALPDNNTAWVGHGLTPLRTVAVDPRVIPLGSLIYIEEFDYNENGGEEVPLLVDITDPTDSNKWDMVKHDGWFVARDICWSKGGEWLDIYVGVEGIWDDITSTLGIGNTIDLDVYPYMSNGVFVPAFNDNDNNMITYMDYQYETVTDEDGDKVISTVDRRIIDLKIQDSADALEDLTGFFYSSGSDIADDVFNVSHTIGRNFSVKDEEDDPHYGSYYLIRPEGLPLDASPGSGGGMLSRPFEKIPDVCFSDIEGAGQDTRFTLVIRDTFSEGELWQKTITKYGGSDNVLKIYDVGYDAIKICGGDFNGDGKEEIAVLNSDGDVTIYWSKMDTMEVWDPEESKFIEINIPVLKTDDPTIISDCDGITSITAGRMEPWTEPAKSPRDDLIVSDSQGVRYFHFSSDDENGDGDWHTIDNSELNKNAKEITATYLDADGIADLFLIRNTANAFVYAKYSSYNTGSFRLYQETKCNDIGFFYYDRGINPEDNGDYYKNLIDNSDFNGDYRWSLYTNDYADAFCTFDDGEAQITITDGGYEPWHVQLRQDGLNIENGKYYSITFAARTLCDEKTIKVTIEEDGGDYTTYGSGEFTLTDELEYYTYGFLMKDPTDPGAGFCLELGDSEEDVVLEFLKVKDVSENAVIGEYPEYEYDNTYYPGDIVEYDGDVYLCTWQDTSGIGREPAKPYMWRVWELVE